MWQQHQTRADLFGDGMSRRGITEAVRAGDLIRARRDRYLPPGTPDVVVRAVRVGGRLTCLSLLQLLGVFVLTNATLHVHLTTQASRLRSPHDRRKPLDRKRKRGTRLHWTALPKAGASTCVDLVSALAHAAVCQIPRAAVASIDSALNKGLIAADQIGDIFDLLPPRYGVLRGLIDGRAQSGPETLVRLMVYRLGASVDLQVEFDDVGFVDLVVDGWLVIECDSKAHHSDWEQQLKDYRRDLTLAQYGYVVLRLVAEDIMYDHDEVFLAVRGALASHRVR